MLWEKHHAQGLQIMDSRLSIAFIFFISVPFFIISVSSFTFMFVLFSDTAFQKGALNLELLLTQGRQTTP